MAIGARQDEAREAPPLKLGPQGFDPGTGLGRRGIIKGLKTGFEHHGRNLGGGWGCGNCVRRGPASGLWVFVCVATYQAFGGHSVI